MVPSDDALGTGARTASVTDLDETSWRMPGERHGLWGMAHPEVASFPLPPQRSHAAFSQLMATWAGSLGREGAVV
jgi:hypothetical protein